MSPRGGDGSRTTLRVALVPFAKTVSPRDGLQALGNHCEPVRKDCGPESCPIRNHREPQNTLICKPASYCLQAATNSSSRRRTHRRRRPFFVGGSGYVACTGLHRCDDERGGQRDALVSRGV